ncbi:response regulator [Gryllotalpicola ginsengisoli]|uniref:response regulator n=1 Tax=Gryllotalpicola ginsengisoli TaxID=444608 RepID=UPI0003B540CF|nr:response regulator transcription factor [Gryllotalpicola ginsengisoli]
MTRVFLVDDHEVVRRGVADLLDRENDIEVVGECDGAAHALGRILATRPDVVLLDVRLPDGNGIDLCREVLAAMPQARCIMLTAYDDDEAVYAAVLAGAVGYVLKDIRGNRLVDSVRRAAAGATLIDAATRHRVTERMRHGADDPRFDMLTTREKQVLSLVADGLSNRQIGAELGLAEKTVKNYVSSLLAKLGLESRTQAALLQVQGTAR